VRVVFDTNVFVSALVIPGSLSEEAYHRALGREFELVTSVAILTELAGGQGNQPGRRRGQDGPVSGDRP
jgi:predicted nucleic acid-binding protein